MAYKNTCPTLKKVGDDEPIFTLRAQDQSAPATIAFWLALNPQLSQERKDEAVKCMMTMAYWPHRKAAD